MYFEHVKTLLLVAVHSLPPLPLLFPRRCSWVCLCSSCWGLLVWGRFPWHLRRTFRAHTPPPLSHVPMRRWLKTWPGDTHMTTELKVDKTHVSFLPYNQESFLLSHRGIVERKLAACVNIVPGIKSVWVLRLFGVIPNWVVCFKYAHGVDFVLLKLDALYSIRMTTWDLL